MNGKQFQYRHYVFRSTLLRNVFIEGIHEAKLIEANYPIVLLNGL